MSLFNRRAATLILGWLVEKVNNRGFNRTPLLLDGEANAFS
jgi:hypothetical protein